MRLLDLFCGAGGASMGYYQAGFDVTGIDIVEQKRYPFKFIKGNALEYLDYAKHFDVIHASPPCQAYSITKHYNKDAPKLIENTREFLEKTGIYYIIENVVGAPLKNPELICGASFNLGIGEYKLSRHRLFETNWGFKAPKCEHSPGKTIGVYGNGTNRFHIEKLGRGLKVKDYQEIMGIWWMTRKELSQAIPPAYTKYIGEQLLKNLYGEK